MEALKQRGRCAFCVIGFLAFPAFLALTGVLHAQSVQPRFEQYRFVIPTCVFQDSLGFLWIGTEVGLYRYDGYRFRQYTIDLNDSSAISDLWVTDIDEDHRGNLWIGTYGGDLNYSDQRTGRFAHFAHMDVWTIVTDDDGSVWLGTKDRGVMNLVLDSQGTPHCRVYDCSDTASSGPCPSSELHPRQKTTMNRVECGILFDELVKAIPVSMNFRSSSRLAFNVSSQNCLNIGKSSRR